MAGPVGDQTLPFLRWAELWLFEKYPRISDTLLTFFMKMLEGDRRDGMHTILVDLAKASPLLCDRFVSKCFAELSRESDGPLAVLPGLIPILQSKFVLKHFASFTSVF
jgi:hypothetical protein